MSWLCNKMDKIPEKEEERKSVKLDDIDDPDITFIDVGMKTKGKYKTKTGMPMGLVVHYTAGRRSLGRDDINIVRPDDRAKSSLKSLANRGLGCMFMSYTGKIFRGQAMDRYAYHAGKSKWRSRTSMSQYLAGMEMNCAGKLDKNRKSWFGVTYPEDQCRYISGGDHGERGWYLKYSPAQELALFQYCMWQLKVNPVFRIDYVVGHHEISPGRKADPGGSASFSMPEFRKRLLEANARV